MGSTISAAMPLQPRRRHLIQIATPHGVEADAPVVWSLGDELYVRPESGGLLASPCDEIPCGADETAFDPASLELLSQKLTRLAPRLAESSVRRGWACLRTFAPDGRPVIGPDPRISGLSWLGGLGGHGMTGAVAAGELLAATLVGAPHALTDLLSPARCL
jgi:D-arginine dehydrogenase